MVAGGETKSWELRNEVRNWEMKCGLLSDTMFLGKRIMTNSWRHFSQRYKVHHLRKSVHSCEDGGVTFSTGDQGVDTVICCSENTPDRQPHIRKPPAPWMAIKGILLWFSLPYPRMTGWHISQVDILRAKSIEVLAVSWLTFLSMPNVTARHRRREDCWWEAYRRSWGHTGRIEHQA